MRKSFLFVRTLDYQGTPDDWTLKENMKASLVLKLLILAYLPLSVYYSLHSSFEESTATADVSAF